MFVQGTTQELFYIGVGLFILLTGYLTCNKTANYEYYKGGIRVLISYLLFSVVTIFFRKYYLGDDSSWFQWLLGVTTFTAIPYGWYIGMWIGLFLLTPFLNILYRNIPSKRQKQLLILILLVISGIPQMLNKPSYNFFLVDNFWANLFPFTLFFAGAYIREYQPRINVRLAVCVIIAMCLVTPSLNFLLFHGGRRMVNITGAASGAFIAVEAVLFFLLFYKMKINSPVLRSIIAKISVLSLDIYLCCYIFDQLLYPYFLSRYFESQAQFGAFFFVVVPLVFSASLIAAWIKEKVFFVFHLFAKVLKRGYGKEI